jgi:cell division transport system permease protein
VRPLRYAWDEAVSSLWRGRQSALLAVATIAVAVFVLGGLFLMTGNLRQLSEEWSGSAQMAVYLNDQVTPPQRAAIEQQLAPGAVIASYQAVSKEQALQRFKETFAELASTIDTLGENPLPASYEARLTPAGGSGPAVEPLVEKLRRLPGVSDVRYDRQWLDRLLGGIRLVQTAGLLLAAMLGLAAALTVANVVRLALVARRDEIEIMHLIGAPPAYVRGPFVVEGVLQGGAGALLALVALAVAYLVLQRPYLAPLADALNVSAVHFLPVGVSLLLLAGGMVVGCLGGLVASRHT